VHTKSQKPITGILALQLQRICNFSHCRGARMIGQAKAFLRVGRPGGTPPLRSGGGWVGAPLQKTPSSALSLPCEIVSISQGRPLLAPEFTTSGQEEAGKGLKIPVCGGSSLHAPPFRQEAAVHWMPMGHGSAMPLLTNRAYAHRGQRPSLSLWDQSRFMVWTVYTEFRIGKGFIDQPAIVR
jgi:hypothetical protein